MSNIPACPEYLEEVRSHFNEPIIVGFEIARVIGYAEDARDCYIILKFPNGHPICTRGKKKIIWHTFVGGFQYLNRLKGQGYVLSTQGEEWDDLYRISSILEINGCPKENEFQISIDKSDDSLYTSTK